MRRGAPGSTLWLDDQPETESRRPPRDHLPHRRRPCAITDYGEFPGRSDWRIAEPGREEIADYALGRALDHVGTGMIA
jgi:hypothetical protein